MARPHWQVCLSVCFPNRNCGVPIANGSYSGNIWCLVLGAFRTLWVDMANPFWTVSSLFAVIWKHSENKAKTTCGKYSVYMENIWWYIGENLFRETLVQSTKFPPLLYLESKRNGIWASVITPKIHNFM